MKSFSRGSTVLNYLIFLWCNQQVLDGLSLHLAIYKNISHNLFILIQISLVGCLIENNIKFFHTQFILCNANSTNSIDDGYKYHYNYNLFNELLKILHIIWWNKKELLRKKMWHNKKKSYNINYKYIVLLLMVSS